MCFHVYTRRGISGTEGASVWVEVQCPGGFQARHDPRLSSTTRTHHFHLLLPQSSVVQQRPSAMSKAASHPRRTSHENLTGSVRGTLLRGSAPGAPFTLSAAQGGLLGRSSEKRQATTFRKPHKDWTLNHPALPLLGCVASGNVLVRGQSQGPGPQKVPQTLQEIFKESRFDPQNPLSQNPDFRMLQPVLTQPATMQPCQHHDHLLTCVAPFIHRQRSKVGRSQPAGRERAARILGPAGVVGMLFPALGDWQGSSSRVGSPRGKTCTQKPGLQFSLPRSFGYMPVYWECPSHRNSHKEPPGAMGGMELALPTLDWGHSVWSQSCLECYCKVPFWAGVNLVQGCLRESPVQSDTGNVCVDGTGLVLLRRWGKNHPSNPRRLRRIHLWESAVFQVPLGEGVGGSEGRRGNTGEGFQLGWSTKNPRGKSEKVCWGATGRPQGQARKFGLWGGLVHAGCCNRIPYTGPRHQQVSGKSPPPGSHGGRGEEALWGLFYRDANPICEGSALMT
ncbi:hypothetical protein Cadr_000006393 [Camelus dromedarius]|uniref:Uncharacterized protein n=1 Tax=Camelus dromedarius TaxID=9838 RepID=A0A5N4E2J7_CAMDR|nr:hypothetical protein Cadr_000006393 [Camelus dromedarius]